MTFSEKLKIKVKEKAAFRCCRCQSISVEVHHIIPQKDGGADTFDNAAPLCPSCHANFGDNPHKRKEISQMRDWWYKKAEKMFSNESITMDELSNINKELHAIKLSQKSDLNDLKTQLRTISERMIDSINIDSAPVTASGIVNTFATSSQEFDEDKLYSNIECDNCGTKIGLMMGSDKCPNCGEKVL